jgi:hypothetical protein
LPTQLTNQPQQVLATRRQRGGLGGVAGLHGEVLDLDQFLREGHASQALKVRQVVRERGNRIAQHDQRLEQILHTLLGEETPVLLGEGLIQAHRQR